MVRLRVTVAQGSQDVCDVGTNRFGTFPNWEIRKDGSSPCQEREGWKLTLYSLRLPLYADRVIKSFRSPEAEQLHARQRVKRFRDFERVAQRKLRQLDIAAELRDLRSPPGNRLEALKGDRQGQYSIRINDQWRICFIWRDGDAYDVEIVDYH